MAVLSTDVQWFLHQYYYAPENFPPLGWLWLGILFIASMTSLLGIFRHYRADDSCATEASTFVDSMYEQYKTSNITKVFKDFYPPADCTQTEKDALIEKRMEVSKSAKALQQEKKLFTAENVEAASQREAAGVQMCDFASNA